MRLTVALSLICMLISGCRDGANASSTERDRPVADAAVFVVVDRRDPNVDRVAVVSGSHAFAQGTPFRSGAPPTGRRETAEFPRDKLLMLEKAAAVEGLEPPFVPGVPALLVGTVASPDSEISWRYFEADNAEVATCFDDLRSTTWSIGTPTDDVPNWIINAKIRKLLKRE